MPCWSNPTRGNRAAGIDKGGYAFTPMVTSLDCGHVYGAGGILAVLLRPGGKGANSANDHVEVLLLGLAVLTVDLYPWDRTLHGERILILMRAVSHGKTSSTLTGCEAGSTPRSPCQS